MSQEKFYSPYIIGPTEDTWASHEPNPTRFTTQEEIEKIRLDSQIRASEIRELEQKENTLEEVFDGFMEELFDDFKSDTYNEYMIGKDSSRRGLMPSRPLPSEIVETTSPIVVAIPYTNPSLPKDFIPPAPRFLSNQEIYDIVANDLLTQRKNGIADIKFTELDAAKINGNIIIVDMLKHLHNTKPVIDWPFFLFRFAKVNKLSYNTIRTHTAWIERFVFFILYYLGH